MASSSVSLFFLHTHVKLLEQWKDEEYDHFGIPTQGASVGWVSQVDKKSWSVIWLMWLTCGVTACTILDAQAE